MTIGINKKTKNNKMDNNEIWVQMYRFDKYEISNLGNIRNGKTKKQLSIRVDGHKYRVCSIYWENKVRTIRVGRYVWMSFNDCDCDQTIDHKDRNSVNDNLDNLRCVSHAENNENRGDNRNTRNVYNLDDQKRGIIYFLLSTGKKTTWQIMKEYGIPLNYLITTRGRDSWRKHAIKLGLIENENVPK